MQSTINLTKGIRSAVASLLILLTVAMAACGGEKKPKGILTNKEFTGLLVEVYVAESRLGQLRLSKDSSERLFAPYEKTLLAKHHIDAKALKETYRYYLSHPAEFEKIYETVMDTLSLRQQHAQASPKRAGAGSPLKPTVIKKPIPGKKTVAK